MSLFLGKIHYWLYDKILWFESLETEILKWANHNNLPTNIWLKEMDDRFGETTGEKPLEEIIDKSNIHGWLQGKISIVEARHAYLITKILEENTDYNMDLKDIFYSQGKLAANDYKGEILKNPELVYNALNDYILEGMPCDRVNEIIESNENHIIWKRSTCLHNKFWEVVSGNVENFYALRGTWVQGFIRNLEGNFKYEQVNEDTQKIVR